MPQGWTIPPELDAEMTPSVRAFVQMLCARIEALEAELAELDRRQGKPNRFQWLSAEDGPAEPDDGIAHAVRLIETFPERPWTIAELAREVNLSRSAFAVKFKEQTGAAPAAFLLESRMQLAVRLLEGDRHHLKEIARRVGYRSVSAFSTAFKRWRGQSPSTYRKAGRRKPG
jgi:AraC-like DNA-binding protein